MKRIFCYGDSNTWGHDPRHTDPATGCSSRYADDVRWTGVMQRELGPEYSVLEEGLNGRTFCFEDPCRDGRNGIEHLAVALRTCDPVDVIIIMLGTNDAKDMFGASGLVIAACAERFVNYCRYVQSEILSRDAKIILAMPADVDIADDGTYWYGFGPESKGRMQELRKNLRAVAERTGCAFLDTGEIAKVDSIDGTHLGPEGHAAVGKALADLVRSVLSDR